METLVSIISEKYLRTVIAWELIMAIKLNCLSYKLKIISFFKEFFLHFEGWAQDYGNSNIFLKPLFRGNLDPFVNNANLGAIAHTSNGT